MQNIIDALSGIAFSPLPLSYSKVNLLLNCGRFYRLRYNEKRKESKEAVFDPEAARVGKFLHAVLEYCMGDAKKHGFDIEKVDYGTIWMSVAKGMELCHSEYDRAMDMRSNTRELLIRLFGMINNYKLTVIPELRFCLSKSGIVHSDVRYPQRAFFGYIDFWGITKNKRVGILLDYKSHSKSSENKESLNFQTMIYLYFMMRMFTSLNTIQAGGVYLPDNLIDLNPIVHRDDLPDIERRIERWLQAFADKYTSGEFIPEKSKYCNWCGYADTCALIGVKNGQEKNQ